MGGDLWRSLVMVLGACIRAARYMDPTQPGILSVLPSIHKAALARRLLLPAVHVLAGMQRQWWQGGLIF
jgi:hypothetical protein